MTTAIIVDRKLFNAALIPQGCKAYELDENRTPVEAVEPIQSAKVYIADGAGLSHILSLLEEYKTI